MISESTSKFIQDVRDALESLSIELERVQETTVAELEEEFADIPEAYTEFLRHLGAGNFGGRFQLFEGVLDPEEIYDPETAQGLEGMVFVGDDGQGYSVAFEPSQDWRIVEVDPTTGTAFPIAESFHRFMLTKIGQWS